MVMGIIALLIGPVTLFVTKVIYGLPFLTSISESGTIANKVSPILPYCLGALALFSLTYAIKHNYGRLDKFFTGGMFVGFTAVTMQMCASPYIQDNRVGILGISESISNIIHEVGAIVGFGCMILWILVGFRKSDKPKALWTAEKKKRNKIYAALGSGMIASLLFFIFKGLGVFEPNYPVVFIAECLMLTFGGLACLVKSGAVVGDR